MKSKEYNELMRTTKKKETHRYREKASYPWLSMMGSGDYRGERQRDTNYWIKDRLQGCIVQHEEYSQYFVIIVSGM